VTRALTAIVGGTVIDGTGRRPIPDALVLIAGERIINVAKASEAQPPDGAHVVDVTGKFVIPGLIDSHAHVVAPCYAPFTRPGDDPLVAMDVFMRGLIGSGSPLRGTRGTSMPSLAWSS
jgi:predicted amidohydrolase YtcJ